jgi:hypothetical protein
MHSASTRQDTGLLTSPGSTTVVRIRSRRATAATAATAAVPLPAASSCAQSMAGSSTRRPAALGGARRGRRGLRAGGRVSRCVPAAVATAAAPAPLRRHLHAHAHAPARRHTYLVVDRRRRDPGPRAVGGGHLQGSSQCRAAGASGRGPRAQARARRAVQSPRSPGDSCRMRQRGGAAVAARCGAQPLRAWASITLGVPLPRSALRRYAISAKAGSGRGGAVRRDSGDASMSRPGGTRRCIQAAIAT